MRIACIGSASAAIIIHYTHILLLLFIDFHFRVDSVKTKQQLTERMDNVEDKNRKEKENPMKYARAICLEWKE